MLNILSGARENVNIFSRNFFAFAGKHAPPRFVGNQVRQLIIGVKIRADFKE